MVSETPLPDSSEGHRLAAGSVAIADETKDVVADRVVGGLVGSIGVVHGVAQRVVRGIRDRLRPRLAQRGQCRGHLPDQAVELLFCHWGSLYRARVDPGRLSHEPANGVGAAEVTMAVRELSSTKEPIDLPRARPATYSTASETAVAATPARRRR